MRKNICRLENAPGTGRIIAIDRSSSVVRRTDRAHLLAFDTAIALGQEYFRPVRCWRHTGLFGLKAELLTALTSFTPHRLVSHIIDCRLKGMDDLKRELQQVLQHSEHPDMLLGAISGVAAWAITTFLRLLLG